MRLMDTILNLQNLITGYKNELTKWEKEQLEIGLKDLDSGTRIPDKTVMKKVNEILK
ncbi:MAG TPA: hypothetical protein PLX69_17565 [Leptospiraceae bacterium]|nr:hypothetical protein [Leptospiraceae bacterium]